MNAPPETPAAASGPHAPAVSPSRTLRRLFLTLFLRGRGARGLRKESAPKSVGSKLALTLGMYALAGMMAVVFLGQPVFALSVYLHALTLSFLGMFVAASAGEVLFNKEEADILMHRPVTARALLWSKIGVLVQVSLWLAGAFNLAGLLMGIFAKGGGWLFPVAHVISTGVEALFCTGSVVLVYQLCLRWFGRERLEGLMTTAQVLMAVGAVLAGQLVPQLVLRMKGNLVLSTEAWWVWLLPPAWFAGFDDALAGTGAGVAWGLAGIGLLVTAGVLWMAFGKLARNYEAGVQMLNEVTGTRKARRSGRRWIHVMVNQPPLRWFLRDSVTRASFLLAAAYLVRDRDVKLRIYPSLAPMLAMPFIFLMQNHDRGGGLFGIALAASYLGIIPLVGLNLLQYSQQWQASDIFRAAPMSGPAPLCHGARHAVLWLLTLPVMGVYGVMFLVTGVKISDLPLLLPGVIALPVFALLPCLGGRAVPFSLPTEEAKSAGRGLYIVAGMLVSMALSGLGTWAWSAGFFWWLVWVETIVSVLVYGLMRARINSVRWESAE